MVIFSSNGAFWVPNVLFILFGVKIGGIRPTDKTLRFQGNFPNLSLKIRRRTNVQQLTCNIDLSCSFYCLFFSFVLIELKPLVLKGKVLF